MKNWNEVERIEDIIPGWNRKGKACYHGFEPDYIDGDEVHKAQVIQPSGGKHAGHQNVIDDGSIEVVIPKTEEMADSMKLYENNYIHEVEFHTFVGASVSKTQMVRKVVGRMGPGKTYGMVPVEKKVPGYMHAVVRIFEVIDLGDSVKFIYGPTNS